MRCSSCEPLLDRFIEGTLAPRQMAAVSQHLKRCDRCHALIQELRVVDALLSSSQPVELAPNFSFAVMAEVRAIPLARKRAFPFWPVLALYLAGVWIAVGGAYALFGARAPWLQAIVGAIGDTFKEAFAAISGVAHGLGATSPLIVVIVSAILTIDALLAGGLYFLIHSREAS